MLSLSKHEDQRRCGVTPKDFKAPALPDFDKLDDAALVKLLESPSHRTRLEAQRTILRREDKPATRSSAASPCPLLRRYIDGAENGCCALAPMALT